MQFKKNNFKNSEFWDKLSVIQKLLANSSISSLFLNDPNRFKNFSIKLPELNLLFDYSKQHIDQPTLDILYNAAKHVGLQQHIKSLFQEKNLNFTENRSAGHPQLRLLDPQKVVESSLIKMHTIASKIYQQGITEILCLGIGGSYIGPKMVCEALEEYTILAAKNINFHFIANHDQISLNKILATINFAKSIVIVSSKSFNTAETINNAKLIKNWVIDQRFSIDYREKFFAITSNLEKAIEFGILTENILTFNINIGGRYSVWSVMSLPIVIKLGISNFKKFLKGGYLMDQHFNHAELNKNIPINMGLISIWNINFMRYKALAVIPYLNYLQSFPEYLQQLIMESNGKSIDFYNHEIDYDSAEIVFGGVGCNVQHSFMQMLHQGTQIIPTDFLVAADPKQEFLFANCLAQSQALMQGTSTLEHNEQALYANTAKHKVCAGNRPSSTILLKELTPEALGGLIALYEHKVFVQSVMWNVNPFDQWGVELGKKLANNILAKIKVQRQSVSNLNHELNAVVTQSDKDLIQGSTIGLIKESFNFASDV